MLKRTIVTVALLLAIFGLIGGVIALFVSAVFLIWTNDEFWGQVFATAIVVIIGSFVMGSVANKA